jgi:hypothetical protein
MGQLAAQLNQGHLHAMPIAPLPDAWRDGVRRRRRVGVLGTLGAWTFAVSGGSPSS